MSDTAAVFQPAIQRPVLIDENDGPCEICAAHVSGKCDSCGGNYNQHCDMGNNGYQTITPTHFHLRNVAGVHGRQAVFGEICRICYCHQWETLYPEEQCQVPELPAPEGGAETA